MSLFIFWHFVHSGTFYPHTEPVYKCCRLSVTCVAFLLNATPCSGSVSDPELYCWIRSKCPDMDLNLRVTDCSHTRFSVKNVFPSI